MSTPTDTDQHISAAKDRLYAEVIRLLDEMEGKPHGLTVEAANILNRLQEAIEGPPPPPKTDTRPIEFRHIKYETLFSLSSTKGWKNRP